MAQKAAPLQNWVNSLKTWNIVAAALHISVAVAYGLYVGLEPNVGWDVPVKHRATKWLAEPSLTEQTTIDAVQTSCPFGLSSAQKSVVFPIFEEFCSLKTTPCNVSERVAEIAVLAGGSYLNPSNDRENYWVTLFQAYAPELPEPGQTAYIARIPYIGASLANVFDGEPADCTINPPLELKPPDESCSSEQKCFIVDKTVEVTSELKLVWIVFTFTLFSGLHHALAALFSETYIPLVLGSRNFFRLADYALTAPLMWIALLPLWVAPPHVADLVNGFSILFAVIVIGFAAETVAAKKEYGLATLFFIFASALYVSAWGLTWGTFAVGINDDVSDVNIQPIVDGFSRSFADNIKTELQANSQSSITYNGFITPRSFEVSPRVSTIPEFVYILLISLMVTFSLFMIPAALRIFSGKDGPADLIRYELVYTILSFTSKVILTGTIGFGVLNNADRQVAGNNAEDAPENNDQLYAALGGSIALGALFAIFIGIDIYRLKNGQGGLFDKLFELVSDPSMYRSLM